MLQNLIDLTQKQSLKVSNEKFTHFIQSLMRNYKNEKQTVPMNMYVLIIYNLSVAAAEQMANVAKDVLVRSFR